VEFTILVTVVLAALLTISVYFKRAVQGRWRSSADEIGEQYDPAAMNSSVTYGLCAQTEVRITTISDDNEGFWTLRHDKSNVVESKGGAARVASP